MEAPDQGAKFPRTIKMWPVVKLVPYARNPRVHSEAEVAELAEQIKRRGWTNPILIDEADGILAGHRRLMAAQLLGLEKVPVIVLTHLNEAEKRALVIADNQTALHGAWDTGLLLEELSALSEAGFDLGEAAFSNEELMALEGADPFHPNLNPNAAAAAGVSDRDVAGAQRAIHDRFHQNQELNRVVCPGCGGEFYVDPGTLEPHEARPATVTLAQREVFERAYSKMQRDLRAGDEFTEGRCLELLAAEYLS
ncbi:MAG TPA: ParB/Srx family N-terminal domain-containing protein [Gemmatimonadales bacterium]